MSEVFQGTVSTSSHPVPWIHWLGVLSVSSALTKCAQMHSTQDETYLFSWLLGRVFFCFPSLLNISQAFFFFPLSYSMDNSFKICFFMIFFLNFLIAIEMSMWVCTAVLLRAALRASPGWQTQSWGGEGEYNAWGTNKSCSDETIKKLRQVNKIPHLCRSLVFNKTQNQISYYPDQGLLMDMADPQVRMNMAFASNSFCPSLAN